MSWITHGFVSSFIKKKCQGVLFVTHNKRNADSQRELFKYNGTGNFEQICCRTALSVMLEIAVKTIFMNKSFNICDNIATMEILCSNDGIRRWLGFIKPNFQIH